jgi:CheY-like chemotaxis protein
VTTVLVVDDEPDLRLLTRLLLELDGYDVLEAVDGRSALEILGGEHAVDTVLLDLWMPGLSGWDVLAALRDGGQLDRLRVVVFSAHLAPREYDRALAEGAAAYLTKPFTDEALVRALTGPGG